MLRNGADYLNGLNDGREIYVEGERVANVAAHPLLRGMAASIAELFDQQVDESLVERLSYTEDGSDERFGLAYLQPRTSADLLRRREAMTLRADLHGGMLGRGPDFMNCMMTAFASASDHFGRGGAQFAANAHENWLRLRHDDLVLTHTLLHPQRDRSTASPTASEDENAARIVGEMADGFIVRGARMLATLAPFSDEIAVFPSASRHLPDSEEAKQFAFACVLPVATPGLRFLCRPSLTPPNGRVVDHPLMSRMDEMDCVVVFDDVLVPWDRTYIYRDTGLTMLTAAGVQGQQASQTAIKDLSKARFLLGLAYHLAEATNIVQFPNVLNQIAEIVQTVEMVRGCVLGSEAAAMPGPNGTLVPDGQILRAQRNYYLGVFPRLQEVLQVLGAGGLMMTVPAAEVEGPRSGDVDEFYAAANLDATSRIDLFNLAADASISGFAGRQALYERFFAGDPWRMRIMIADKYPQREQVSTLVTEFLERSRKWDTALRP